ncbi:MAG TPA: SRPBCC family protein [Chryseosolibacter sp.]|nr:SRPBCC family protein [Chryseosolibacter sp.]
MKIYHLIQNQFLPITIQAAWDFFSSPTNLARITPPHMRFKIVYISGNGSPMYAGQVMRYKIGILPGVTSDWMTEITHVHEPVYFVDDQVFGPYALWHHEHRFKEVAGGVEMTDEIHYAIPYGIIGRLANWLFVDNQVKKIFEYREEIIRNIFAVTKTPLRQHV